MTVHKVLCSKYRGRTAGEFAKVGTSHNGKFVPIGTGLPTTLEGDGAAAFNSISYSNCKNRVAEFEGNLYAVQRADIYKLNKATNEWELDHAASGTYDGVDDLGYSMSMGLYVAAQGGTNYLYHIWASNDESEFRSVRKQGQLSGNGLYETEIIHTVPFSAFNQTAGTTEDSLGYGGILDVVEFNSKVYGVCTRVYPTTGEDLYSPFVYDLMNQTMGSIALPAIDVSSNRFDASVGFCAHDSRLFFLYGEALNLNNTQNTIQRFLVTEFIGSTAVKRLTIDQGDGILAFETRVRATSKPIMFSDGTYMYAGPITSDTSTIGYKIHRIQTSGAGALADLGEIESGIFPDSMVRGSRRIDANSKRSDGSEQRVSTYVQVDASGNEEIILAHFNDRLEGSPGAFWKWNDSSTPMTFLGRGHGPEMALPSMRQGGGAYLYSEYKPFQIQIEDIQASPTPGNIRILYRMVGGSGEAAVARFLFNKDLGAAKTFASLESVTSPVVSSGVAVSGSYITGIIADQNIVYKIDWKAELDGIQVGDDYVINPVALVGALIP